MRNPLSDFGNRLISGAGNAIGRKLRDIMPGHRSLPLPQEPSQTPRGPTPSFPKLPRLGKPTL